jgi:3-dehydroquinate dehydratase-2
MSSPRQGSHASAPSPLSASAPAHPRIEVMHGVNLDQLGRRDPALYGTLTLSELERSIAASARELDMAVSFFQSNHEGAFVERLHALREDGTDAILLNPGAWTHYAWAIRDALEIAALPALEIHLSDVERREPWRRVSVIRELCFATISGRGPDGYREALLALRERLREGRS